MIIDNKKGQFSLKTIKYKIKHLNLKNNLRVNPKLLSIKAEVQTWIPEVGTILRIKDDRMEKTLKGRRFMHNLL